MTTNDARRREIIRVTPTLVLSRDYRPTAHADPAYRGGYLLLLPGKIPEIVLDGLATQDEQQEAEARCLEELEKRRVRDQPSSAPSPRPSAGSSVRPAPAGSVSPAPAPKKGLIGQQLVAAGLLSVNNLHKMLERQKSLAADRPVRRLASLLVEVGLLNMRQASEALGEQRGVPASSTHGTRVQGEVQGIFPREVLFQVQAAPLFLVGKSLGVAMADPHDEKQVELLQSFTAYAIRPLQAPQIQIQRLLESMRSGPSRSSAQGQPGSPQTSGVSSGPGPGPAASHGSGASPGSSSSAAPASSASLSSGRSPRSRRSSSPPAPAPARQRLSLRQRTRRTVWAVSFFLAVSLAFSAGFYVKLRQVASAPIPHKAPAALSAP